MKEYMQPKWWLTGVGTIFTIFMLLTYTEIMNAAETGWGADNYDNRDVFYEKAWSSNVLWVAIIALASGFLIEGRALSIVAMAISGGYVLSFILQNLANGDLGYGYLEPANAAPGMVAAAGLLLSGYLHLGDE